MHHPWFTEAMGPNVTDKAKEKLHEALDNFMKFNSGNKIKQAALGFMIQHFMTQREAQELGEAFK